MVLDECAPEIDSDKPVSGETISPQEDWQFGQDTCNYVNTMVSAWGQESDKPTGGRHQWAMTRAVRLAAAFRVRCITEDDLKLALQALEAALAYWCQTVGEPRELTPDEVGSASLGVATVATFDDERTRTKLGDHTHGPQTARNGSGSVAARLVDMACELYQQGVTGEGQPFATMGGASAFDVGAVRPDLADRLVLVDVKCIKAEDRRGETDLDQQWGKVLPQVFGGLLDLAAAVHQRLPELSLPSSPRMADFAKVLAATRRFSWQAPAFCWQWSGVGSVVPSSFRWALQGHEHRSRRDNICPGVNCVGRRRDL
ncbi:MAG: hypothetical protein ACM4D3_17235 [Candidatus Sericytochromatia bacterium]